MSKEKIDTLAATDLDEFYVEKIIGHSGPGGIQRSGSLESVGLDMSLKTILCWIGHRTVKDLAALDEYSKENPHLNLG